MQPVYEEILKDVKQGTKIWADETGWRVKGKLWWLWINPNDTLKAVIKKVHRQKEHILIFIKHDDAPHHNNYGEYIIKKGVVKRKMSGGSMSAEGVEAYACIQSIAMTCQLRGISFHHFLKESLVCYIRTGNLCCWLNLSAILKKRKSLLKISLSSPYF